MDEKQTHFYLWLQPRLLNALKALAGAQKVPTYRLMISILETYVEQRKLKS